jgi:hypothetical protein
MPDGSDAVSRIMSQSGTMACMSYRIWGTVLDSVCFVLVVMWLILDAFRLSGRASTPQTYAFCASEALCCVLRASLQCNPFQTCYIYR